MRSHPMTLSVALLAFVLGVSTEAHAQACLTVLPEISLISPDPALPATEVLITGSHFQSPPCLYDVTIGGESTLFVWVGPTQILATVPALLPGTYPVAVKIHGGGTATGSLEVAATIPACTGSAPTITEVTPEPGMVGGAVTIGGTGFECVNEVTFGGQPAPFVVMSETQIEAIVPVLESGTVDVVVSQESGDSNAYPFDVEEVSFICLAVWPEISEVSPDPAPPGSLVTISGSSFQSPPCLYDVTFGGVSSPGFVWTSGATIQAVVPDLPAGNHPVRVHIHVGGTSEAHDFEVIGPSGCDPPGAPTLTSTDPESALPTTEISVFGSGFDGTACLNSVLFDDTPSPSVEVVSDTELRVVVPLMDEGPVAVTAVRGGAMSNPIPFTVLGSPVCLAVLPHITDVLPGGAPPLEWVTIHGYGFQPEPCLYAVTFGGAPSPEFSYIDSQTIVARVPTLPPGPAPIRVHIAVGGTSNPHYFLVLPPYPSGLSCTGTISGSVGTVELTWDNPVEYYALAFFVDGVEWLPADPPSLGVGPDGATLDGLAPGGVYEICLEVRLVLAVEVPISYFRICCTVDLGGEPEFVRGDCNTDGAYNIADAIHLLNHLFGGTSIHCDDACDANDDGGKNIADAISILATLFSGAALPPSPHPDCGSDPTPDLLHCEEFAPCL